VHVAHDSCADGRAITAGSSCSIDQATVGNAPGNRPQVSVDVQPISPAKRARVGDAACNGVTQYQQRATVVATVNLTVVADGMNGGPALYRNAKPWVRPSSGVAAGSNDSADVVDETPSAKLHSDQVNRFVALWGCLNPSAIGKACAAHGDTSDAIDFSGNGPGRTVDNLADGRHAQIDCGAGVATGINTEDLTLVDKVPGQRACVGAIPDHDPGVTRHCGALPDTDGVNHRRGTDNDRRRRDLSGIVCPGETIFRGLQDLAGHRQAIASYQRAVQGR